MTALFGPQGSNAVVAKPQGSTRQRYGGNQTWVKDCTGPGVGDGTVLDAAFYNRIIGALDYLVGVTNISVLPGDDSALYRAILEVISSDAPTALNTLRELADAIADDPNFSATMMTLLSRRIQFDQAQTLTTSEQLQAQANLGLATVADTGFYSDLSGKPPLGASSVLDVGGPNGAVQFDSSGRYPPADGSLIQNLPSAQLGGRSLVGLIGSSTTSTLTVTADCVLFKDATSGVSIAEYNVASLSCNITTAGPAAGGRDQFAAFASNATVHFYFIRKADGTKGLVASTSAPSAGPTLPTGYTSWAYATTIVTQGANLPLVWVRGAKVQYRVVQNIVPLSTAAPTSNTTASTAAVVPANALRLSIQVKIDNTTATTGQYKAQVGTDGVLISALFMGVSASSATAAASGMFELPNVGQSVLYVGDSALTRMGFDVNGYVVANGDS